MKIGASWRLRLAAALGAAALAAPAAAYVRTVDPDNGKGLFWPMPVVPYFVSDAQPSFPSPSCAAGPAGDPTLDAVRAGFSAWRADCADFDLVFAGQIPEIRTPVDGTRESIVVFRRGWCSANSQASVDPCMTDPAIDCGGIYGCFEDHGSADRFIVALTSVLYDPNTGRIFDAGIEVNGWDGQGSGTPVIGTSGPAHGWYFTCAAPAGLPECVSYGDAGCYYVDLQNTVTHEAGHFVGLAHPCGDAGEASCPSTCAPTDTACQSLLGATMFPTTTPGDTGKRTLSPDDVAGLCAIYPASGGGGCGCGSGGAPGAIAALLALLALRPRRPRARQATRSPA